MGAPYPCSKGYFQPCCCYVGVVQESARCEPRFGYNPSNLTVGCALLSRQLACFDLLLIQFHDDLLPQSRITKLLGVLYKLLRVRPYPVWGIDMGQGLSLSFNLFTHLSPVRMDIQTYHEQCFGLGLKEQTACRKINAEQWDLGQSMCYVRLYDCWA